MKRTYHAQRPTTMTTEKTPYADLLNIKVIFVENGTAHVQTTVRTEHTNHVGTAHGGFINSLADYALELASNSHDVLAVALSTSTQYFKPAVVGTILEAVARETHLGRKTATYHIDVLAGEETIATFTGTVYRKG